MGELLGPTEIREAFRRLALRLERRHLVGDICVYGGAAMILAYDSRRVTRDVDGLFQPHGPILEQSRAVGRDMGLPDGWLNDNVSAFVSPVPDARQPYVYDHPHLRVRSVSARHLVAMKAIAARRYAEDRADLVTLILRLGLSDAAEVGRICAEVFPDEPLTDRCRAVILEAFTLASGEREDSIDVPAAGLEGERRVASSAARRRPATRTVTCGTWVESAGAKCILRPGHKGSHRSRV